MSLYSTDDVNGSGRSVVRTVHKDFISLEHVVHCSLIAAQDEKKKNVVLDIGVLTN